MEVSIKKAAELARGAGEAASKIKIEPTIRVSVHAEDPNIANARDALGIKIDTQLALIGAQYWLREQIGTANARTGIDGILTNRARLDAQIKVLSALIENFETAIENENDPAVSVTEKAALKDQHTKATDRYGFMDRNVTFRVVDAEMVANIKRRLAAFKRLRSDLTDRVAGLNLNTRITLPSEIVTALAGVGLIEAE